MFAAKLNDINQRPKKNQYTAPQKRFLFIIILIVNKAF